MRAQLNGYLENGFVYGISIFVGKTMKRRYYVKKKKEFDDWCMRAFCRCADS